MTTLRIITFLLVTFSCTLSYAQEQTTAAYSKNQDLKITTARDISIDGTLSYADDSLLVIFIAGSGPTDRNCNSGMGLESNAFLMLADELKRRGLSSFRYDKRGIGESSSAEESELDLYTFIEDVDSLVNHFSRSFHNIVLLGHSEGSMLGTYVAARNNHVKKLIAVSGTSVTMDQLILDQLQKFPKLVPMAEKHFEEIKAGDTLSAVNPMLMSLFRPSIVPFMKSVFEIDPSVEISTVQKPILIVSGNCDMQVDTSHAVKLKEFAPKAKLVLIPNMGHVMKQLEDDCSNAMAAYSDPNMPLNDQFINSVVNFLNQKIALD